MEELLGHPANGRRARLPGFRIAFTAFADDWGGGVADVVRDEEGEVEGVAFDLSPADVLRLEVAEGLAEGLYRRRRVRIEVEEGARGSEGAQGSEGGQGSEGAQGAGAEETEAITDEVARKRPHVAPSAAYLDAMVSGATEQGLSQGYINWLLQLYPDDPTPHSPAWSDEE